jgi:hypothetical protein
MRVLCLFFLHSKRQTKIGLAQTAFLDVFFELFEPTFSRIPSKFIDILRDVFETGQCLTTSPTQTPAGLMDRWHPKSVHMICFWHFSDMRMIFD